MKKNRNLTIALIQILMWMFFMFYPVIFVYQVSGGNISEMTGKLIFVLSLNTILAIEYFLNFYCFVPRFLFKCKTILKLVACNLIFFIILFSYWFTLTYSVTKNIHFAFALFIAFSAFFSCLLNAFCAIGIRSIS